jgi:ATP-dependent DNA helicase RecQ
MEDGAEKQRAWERYRAIRRFAESKQCRHRQVCLHFGETPKWERCDACDVCGVDLDWMNPNWRDDQPDVPAVKAARRKLVQESADVDPVLRQRLREWRTGLAKEMSVPAYVILHDATLDAICRTRPRTIAELRDVPGIGERKAARFGEAILKIVD